MKVSLNAYITAEFDFENMAMGAVDVNIHLDPKIDRLILPDATMHPEVINMMLNMISGTLVSLIKEGERKGMFKKQLAFGEIIQTIKDNYVAIQDADPTNFN